MRTGKIIRSGQFKEVTAKGKRLRGRLLTVYFIPDEKKKELSYGITVSKRNAKRAIRRNYIKRIIRAFFLMNGDRIKRSGSVVVRLTRPVHTLSKKNIANSVRKDLEKLFQKGGILGERASSESDQTI